MCKNNYYDDYEYSRIKMIIKDDRLDYALLKMKNYLEKYPGDVCACCCYADIYMRLGEFEKAKEVLENIVVTKKTPVKSVQNLKLMKIKLLSCLQEYDKCLSLIKENLDMFEERNWNLAAILIYIKRKLNLLIDGIDYTGDSFLLDQIVSYNEEEVIKYLEECSSKENNGVMYSFNDDFCVRDVYYMLRDKLPLEDKIYDSVITNIYIFRYDNNGKIDNKVVNYLKVITLQGTNNIISIRPYRNFGNISCTDLTPVYDDEKLKVKRLSQIDKFNLRYLSCKE